MTCVIYGIVINVKTNHSLLVTEGSDSRVVRTLFTAIKHGGMNGTLFLIPESILISPKNIQHEYENQRHYYSYSIPNSSFRYSFDNHDVFYMYMLLIKKYCQNGERNPRTDNVKLNRSHSQLRGSIELCPKMATFTQIGHPRALLIRVGGGNLKSDKRIIL